MEKYSFIDMHMHSAFSNEKGVTNSPQDLINKALLNAKDGRRVAISITDHNNVRATGVALKYIQENDLDTKVEYVSGAEFNSGTKSLGKFTFEGKRKAIYGSMHLLGYGFDHKDEEIVAFCDLRELHIAGSNVGDQICAARNLIKQETGIDVPFKYLARLIPKAKNGVDVYSSFVSLVKNYAALQGESLKEGTIISILGPYFNADLKHNDMAIGKAKLDVQDLSRMIKNAGGICVLAHPTFLTYKQKTILHDVSALDEFVGLLNEKEKLIDGMEFFYPAMSNFKEFPAFYELAIKHGLFLSAGSDYHGFAEKYPRVIGKVFDVQIDNHESEFFFSKDIKNRVIYLPILDYIKYRKQETNKQMFLMAMQDVGEVAEKEALIKLFEIQQQAKAQMKPKIEERFKPEMDKNKLDILNAIKTLQKVNTLSLEACLPETTAARNLEISATLRAMLTTGFFSIQAANKHFNQFSYVQSHLQDFKHFALLVGVLKATFEKIQEVSKDFRFENRDVIKAIENLHIKYAHNFLKDEHIVPDVEVVETPEGKRIKLKDESFLLEHGLTTLDLLSEEPYKKPVQNSRSTLKKALKALTKIETCYAVVLNEKVPENVKELTFEELKNILNSSISAINATIINFYDVQYITIYQKEFREFVDCIESIKLSAMEVSERNLPYASGNSKICDAFQSMNIEEIVSGKQK